MYICNNCRTEILESDVISYRSVGVHDVESPEMRMDVFCPVCGTSDIRPMETADYDL